MIKRILTGLISLATIILVFGIATTYQGRFIGYNIKHEKDTSLDLPSIEALKSIIPEAESFRSVASAWEISNSKHQIIGALEFPEKGTVEGFGGNINFALVIDTGSIVKGLILLKHSESSEYVKNLYDTGLLSAWNGKHIAKLHNTSVDIISGASISSKAIINGVNKISETYNPVEIETVKTQNGKTKINIPMILGWLWLMFILFNFIKPQVFKKYSTYIQLITVILFGFILSKSLSLYIIYNWLMNGWSGDGKLLMLAIIVLSVVLPIFTGKSFYCGYYCPYGNLQHIANKLSKKNIKIPHKAYSVLKHLREAIFFALLFMLWLGVYFDLTLLEPFSAFSYKIVGTWTMVFAITFAVISIFIPKAWCRFFCPTGLCLDTLKVKKDAEGKQTPKSKRPPT
ncbi:MAG: 4Fe-4S binding protein [Bacteroidales bacterium]